MNILIIGGTRFIGPHIVRAAAVRGHEITLFHRGQSVAEDLPEVRRCLGDREVDLDRLDGEWDAVIDTCGYVPRVVGLSADHLRDRVGRYLFVSSISAVGDLTVVGHDESAAPGVLTDPTVETIDGDTYGPLKAACEAVVQEAFGDRATLVRPGLIVGPGDSTDRYTYWPRRIARGGPILAPAPANTPTQVIDARDLASWMIRLLEGQQGGIFNGVGPVMGMGELIAATARGLQETPELVWVDPDFLESQEVTAWADLPCWIPATNEQHSGMLTASNAKALETGLRTRPLQDTAKDALAWFGRQNRDAHTGLSAEREASVLAEWYESRAR